MLVKVNDGFMAVDMLHKETVADLKVRIANELDVSVDDFYLSHKASPLVDEAEISAEHELVEVMVRLRGGKVHGSLARAGKVRGQTPKVDKEEKKKAKTGRAKRRMQYNRRFVNVVAQGPGRRVGPNSNSRRS